MCDTFVALSIATKDGSVIFGKNSDRHPNEGHELTLIPRASHPKGALVDCTYIRVPQVRQTNAVLLSKPIWIWGAEMGANEHGVVIGNEAVFTKVPYGKQPGLIGMDFIRLALERASTADEALDVMIELLETYGQGGNAMFNHKMFYHNGFLIADPHSAWIFETAGQHWAAEKVRDVRTISNLISIGSNWDRASTDLVSHAVSKGWCKNPETFNFSECYSDLVYTNFAADTVPAGFASCYQPMWGRLISPLRCGYCGTMARKRKKNGSQVKGLLAQKSACMPVSGLCGAARQRAR